MGEEEIIDKSGIVYKTKEELEEAIKILQKNIVNDPDAKPGKEIKLNDLEQAEKQLQQQEKFNHEKSLF